MIFWEIGLDFENKKHDQRLCWFDEFVSIAQILI